MAARTSLPLGLAAAWPLNEANGANRLNLLNPASLVLVQTGGVTKVAGPSAAIPFATHLVGATPQYLNLINAAMAWLTQPFSIAFWMNADAPGAYQSTIGIQTNPGAVNTFLSVFNFTAPSKYLGIGYIDIYQGVNGVGLNNNGINNPAVWLHIAFTWDGLLCHTYINGGEQTVIDSSFFPMPAGPYDLSLGSIIPGAGSYTGSLAQLAMWSRAITDAEVAILYNGGNGRSLPFA